MFEFMPEDGTDYRAVTEPEAMALLRNYTRDSGKALERLRANHYAQLNCEGGRIRFNFHLAVVGAKGEAKRLRAAYRALKIEVRTLEKIGPNVCEALRGSLSHLRRRHKSQIAIIAGGAA